jgi:hypothetical protein
VAVSHEHRNEPSFFFVTVGNFLTSLATVSFSRTEMHEVKLLKKNDGHLEI